MRETGPDTASDAREAAFTLATILNVLYRGRRPIVYLTVVGVLLGVAYAFLTTPLYLATTQIRPGIVAYTPDGGPVREWALKDIVHWFRAGLYWESMRELPIYSERLVPPIIEAEFIETGPQFSRGGNVITLSTLAADPDVALTTLRSSIDAFNEHVRDNDAGSSLALSAAGLENLMTKLRQSIAMVTADQERNSLEIEKMEKALAVIGERRKLLAFKLTLLRGDRAWRLAAADSADAEISTARIRLDRAVALLNRSHNAEEDGAGPYVDPSGSVSTILEQSMRTQRREGLGDLMLTVNELSRYVQETAIRTGDLRREAEEIALQIADLEFEKDVTLVQEEFKTRNGLRELEIVATNDLPLRVKGFQADLASEEVRLQLLVPLERVGPVGVSLRPVRPRKLRAIVILGVLAFVGSLFLVFTLEYLRRHRGEILIGTGSR